MNQMSKLEQTPHPIHCECLDIKMSLQQNLASGSLVNATRFHADKSVFNYVNATDAMFSTKKSKR